MEESSLQRQFFKVIAHRGASGHAPENTMASFQKGLELGANVLELDIHMSRDGELVVIHDHKLDRTTTGTGYVKNYSVKELKRFDAAKLFEAYRGEKIPLLREVFELAKGKAAFAVEIKKCPIFYPGIEKKLVRLIEQSDLVDNVIVIAFYPPSLRKIKRYNPDIKTGILFGRRLIKPWIVAAKIRANALHPRYDYLGTEMVQEAHKRGFLVHPWTINSATDLERWIKGGVDGITTDYPDVLTGLLKTCKQQMETLNQQLFPSLPPAALPAERLALI